MSVCLLPLSYTALSIWVRCLDGVWGVDCLRLNGRRTSRPVSEADVTCCIPRARHPTPIPHALSSSFSSRRSPDRTDSSPAYPRACPPPPPSRALGLKTVPPPSINDESERAPKTGPSVASRLVFDMTRQKRRHSTEKRG
ncbi:hypothetical protein BC567DRAFT_223388 [Phyllosticta citribraziliensis]